MTDADNKEGESIMKFDFLTQAAKFLQERKAYRRWLAVFMCLALAVTFGTVAALKMYGQAMTHQVKVLECQYKVHEHTEDCYEKNEDGEPTGEPVCGYADYVVHTHNDDCYDENKNLVCPLEEIEKHEHDDGCYEEEEILVCGEDEAESTDGGHEHTDACYTEVKGELICEASGEDGHTHDESCYSKTLTCDREEHTHDDGCYEKELVCDNEDEDHAHDDGCYEETFACDKEEHEHGDDCYSEELTCGQEESGGHEHTDDCYEMKKELTCEEGEGESKDTDGHTHDEDCYKTEKTLTCGELELHTHTEALEEDGGCYDESAFDEDGEFIEGSRPVCGIPQLEEHVHTAECFKVVELTGEEVAQLNAGGKLHVHDENCYDADGNLICEIPSVHVHGLECYDEDGNLICGSGWAHTHDESCYDENGNLICEYQEDEETHEHDANCYDADGNLICGHEDAKDHQHDGSCYDAEGNLTCGYEGVKDHQHTADCYDIKGNLICGYEGVEDHVHSEACYDEEGNLICGYELREEYTNSRIFENEKYVVIAKYNDDANIPEEAELLVEEITPDSDKEYYARRETEYREMMEDEMASMRALLKIGFYMETEGAEEKTEIEPATPVMISVQFLGEDGLPDGSPVTIIHFAEDGTEMLDGGSAVDNSTTFKMESFSEIAIGYGSDEVKKTEDGTLKFHLSDNFEYANDAFHITFHVEGDAVIPEGTDLGRNETAADQAGVEENGQIESEDVNDEDKVRPFENQEEENKENSDDTLQENGVKTSDGEIEPEEAVSETDESVSGDTLITDPLEGDLENKEKDVLAVDTVDKKELKFSIKPLSEKSDEYKALVTYSEGQEGSEELLRRQILSCNLTYRGVELDLSECKITADVSMTKALEEELEKSIPNAAAYLTNSDGKTFEQTGDGQEVSNSSDENSKSYAEEEDGVFFSDATEETDTDDISTVTSDEPSLEKYNMSENTFDFSINNQNDDSGLGCETDICFSFYSITKDGKVVGEKKEIVNEETAYNTVQVQMEGAVFASEISSIANVHFNVGYYAEIETVAKKREDVPKGTTIAKELVVFDTSGKNLPKNGVEPVITNIFLDSKSNVIKKSDMIEIYSKDTNIAYFKQPNLSYFNKLRDNPSYNLIRIEVGTEKLVGGEIVFTLEESFPVPMKDNVPDLASVHFTNKIETKQEHPEYILLREGTTVRLVYKTTGEEYPNDAVFYDYDISTGTVRESSNAKIIDTKAAGINHPDNCSADVKYAFGNKNAGTNYGTKVWSNNGVNNSLNMNNATNSAFTAGKIGCTFGLVKEAKGKDVVFNVAAPKVFGNDVQKGKTIYENQYGLIFDRVGDTYTLKSVSGTNTANLDKFTNTTGSIWSNNFWPMDDAPSWGTGTHDMKFGNASNKDNLRYEPGPNKYHALPVSDDGKDHNSYFGMYYSINFNLDKDYVGPLEYLFFGDDDMWVFLDDKQLVCDIGGVHSSVGEYVNLWDYLKNDDGTTKTGTHTLKFFYTERGASGSTCWMQFTLPSVTENKTKQTTGSMRIGKSVVDKKTGNALDIDNEFEFNIKLTDAMDDYSYTKYDADGTELMKDVIVWDGADFTLKNGQYIEVSYLPIGTEFTITEKEGVDSDLYYYTEIEVDGVVQREPEETDSPKTATGVISTSESTVNVKYKNLLYVFELPETGGFGTNIYTMAGVLCLIFGAGFMYRKKFRGRRV